jgi:outer membrane protein TolC
MNQTQLKRMTLWVALSLTFSAVISAQAGMDLSNLLAKSPQALTVQIAVANLESAKEVLGQLQADPTTLKADLLTAQSSMGEAQSSLMQARLQTRVNMAQTYFNVVASEAKLKLDQGRSSLAQTEVGVAKERVKLGSGTALAVEQAQAALIQVQQDLKVDEVQLKVQRELLRNLLDLKELPALDAKVPASSAVPGLPAIQAAALKIPSVIKASGAVEVAKLKLEQAQTDSTPVNQRSVAKQALLSAQLEYQSQALTARQAAEQAYINALSAQAALDASEAATAAQETALKTAQAQEKAGTISRLQVQGTSLSLQQARYALLQAQQSAYLTRLSLELAAPQEVK